MQATSINTFVWCVYGLMVQPINKVQITAISTLSNLIAELSLRTMWHVTRHVARDKHSMCCYVICTRLCPGHLSERVRDSSRRSEEIVEKISNCAFQCDYYYYYYYYYYYHYYYYRIIIIICPRWSENRMYCSIQSFNCADIFSMLSTQRPCQMGTTRERIRADQVTVVKQVLSPACVSRGWICSDKCM